MAIVILLMIWIEMGSTKTSRYGTRHSTIPFTDALKSFLQQVPNELTREGKLGNVLGIFNKLVFSWSNISSSEKLLHMESVLKNEDIEVDSIMEDDEESEDETYVGKSLEEAHLCCSNTS